MISFGWQDEDILGQLQDPDFLSVLAKIRKRENLESLADREAERGEAEDQPRVKKRKREKPVLLKDVAREMVSECHSKPSPLPVTLQAIMALLIGCSLSAITT